MADFETNKITHHTIVVPDQIIYPETRITLDSGLLKERDRIIIQIIVRDADGNEKFNTQHRTVLRNYPTDKEVLGVAHLHFVESGLPQDQE